MPLNTPPAGSGYFAVTTQPGATVYFYATANFGVGDAIPSAGQWAVLNGTLAADGTGVIADSSGIAAIQAPWITPGNYVLAVCYGTGARCGLGIVFGNMSPTPGSVVPLNKRGFRGPLALVGRLGVQQVRLR